MLRCPQGMSGNKSWFLKRFRSHLARSVSKVKSGLAKVKSELDLKFDFRIAVCACACICAAGNKPSIYWLI